MTETAKWYEKAGNCGDVVISTRVRLARNLKQYPFPTRATDKQREAVEQKVKDALLSGNSILSKEFRFLPLESASEEEAVSLVERHIVSPEFISDRRGKAVLISEDESISIMINEEDHLRIQVLREGLSLKEAAETADRIDTLLSETLDFAYDSEFGYLTQCPTNLGTGLRASVMLHLPALTESGAMPRVSSNLSKLGLTLRGTYGEGSKITGALYQLSNQITLGLSESEAVENLRAITVQLMEEERKARSQMSENIAWHSKNSQGPFQQRVHGAAFLYTPGPFHRCAPGRHHTGAERFDGQRPACHTDGQGRQTTGPKPTRYPPGTDGPGGLRED